MNDTEWAETVSAYRQGLHADLLCGMYQGHWGATYTLTPNSLEAARRAARQFAGTRPEVLRHVRHVKLRNRVTSDRELVLMTELPQRNQQARDLHTLEDVELRVYLHDTVLEALMECFS